MTLYATIVVGNFGENRPKGDRPSEASRKKERKMSGHKFSMAMNKDCSCGWLATSKERETCAGAKKAWELHVAEANKPAKDEVAAAPQITAQDWLHEHNAHDQIAAMCFNAGASTDDGTSVGAVRGLVKILKEAQRELATVRAERQAAKPRMDQCGAVCKAWKDCQDPNFTHCCIWTQGHVGGHVFPCDREIQVRAERDAAPEVIKRLRLLVGNFRKIAYEGPSESAQAGPEICAALLEGELDFIERQACERDAAIASADEIIEQSAQDALSVQTTRRALRSLIAGKIRERKGTLALNTTAALQLPTKWRRAIEDSIVSGKPCDPESVADCADELEEALAAIANNAELEEVFAALSDATVELGMEVGFSWSAKNHLESAKKFITRILAANNTELESKLEKLAEKWDEEECMHAESDGAICEACADKHGCATELRAALAGQSNQAGRTANTELEGKLAELPGLWRRFAEMTDVEAAKSGVYICAGQLEDVLRAALAE